MATVRPQKPAAPVKSDAFVEQQLDRARRRIRLLDVSTGLLLVVAGTLVYALALGLLDRSLAFSPLTRQIAFVAYLSIAIAFLAFGVVRPLVRRVNPYFAARAVEGVVPGSKNSLVNWLDLHEQTLPAAIRASIGQRAAEDFDRADLEQAISARRVVWLTVLAAVLLFALFGVLVTSGVGGFSTLLSRVFAPFGGGATARRTQLTLERPANGDAVLGVGQAFDVAVRVEGRVPDPQKPDALKLLYRYRDGEPYEEQLLAPENGDVWMTVVPPSRTFNGFWYKVAGGDAETPEFHVTVRSTPLVERFDITYHYRAYTGWTDTTSHEPSLKALRGTEAELVIHTNRPVKDGRLEVETHDAKQSVPAVPMADNPQAMRGHFVLDQSGQYRVRFTTTDGDTNLAAAAYTIQAEQDLPPKVELSEPAADVTLPADGTLKLKGLATDDIGIKDVTLHLRKIDGPALQSQPYRSEKALRLGELGYPKKVAYEDFVALDQLKDEKGAPFALAKGMVLEYWLEAADACDYPPPGPNRAQSKHYKVNIIEPTADKSRQQRERNQAAAEKKQHEAKQDEDLKKEEQQRQQQAEEKKKEQDKRDGKAEPKEGDKPENEADKGQDKKGDAAVKDLQKALKDEERQREKSDTKGPQDGKGDGKGDNPSPGQTKGDAKPQGQKGEGQEGSEKGEGAKPDGKQPDTGGGKSEGKPSSDTSGDGKGQGNGEADGAASAKGDGPPKPDKSGGKDEGQGQGTDGAAAGKDQGAGPNGEKESSAKGAGQDSAAANQSGSAKGDQPSLTKGESKPGADNGEAKGGGKGEGKPQADAAQAEAKAGTPEKAGDPSTSRGAAKDDPKNRNLASELKRWEEELRHGDGRRGAEAEKRIEGLSRNATDKEVRDLAGKILDDARKDRASSPALPKGPPRDEKGDPTTSEGKGDGQGKDTAGAKGGGKDAGAGKQEGNVQATPGAGRDSGQGRIREGTSIAGRQDKLLQGWHADEAFPQTADPSHRRWAGGLQVKDPNGIDKSILEKILKDHKITPQELRARLAASQEDEERATSRNDRIGNRGARAVETDKNGSRGDRTGVGDVPPEFRGAYQDYTRRQSEKK